MGSDFAYSNHSHRPRGPVLSTLSAVVPAVRVVQEQVRPYATWWEQHNRVAASGAEPLWVALGDSMTQGIGASAPDRGWVGQLDERLTRRGWDHRVVNLGVNGARVEDVLERQLPVLEALSTAELPAALVTVVIGSNDIVLRRHRRWLVERFGRMLDLLPQHAVVSNLPNPRHEARTIDAMLRERADAGRLVLVDLRREGPRSWRGRLASDKFHPNDRGYADLATIVERALERSGLLPRP